MKNTFSLFFLLLTSIASSQISFEKAYIIDNNGNKIDCYIKNLDWLANPSNFDYKLSEDSKVIKASVDNISEFRIYDTDEYYKRFILKSDLSNDSGIVIEKRNKQVYLRVLVEGQGSLYEYSDNGVVFFYQLDGSEIVKLNYQKNVNEKNKILEDNAYKRQLFNELSCTNFNVNDFINLNYNKRDLVALFSTYNQCSNVSYEDFSKYNTKTKLNLKLMAGLGLHTENSTRYKILYTRTSPGPNYVEEYNIDNKLESQTGINLGFELEMLLPFRKNHWSVYVSPNYQNYSKNSREDIVNDEFLTFDLNYTVNHYTNYKFIELPFGVRYYSFLNDKSRLFINAAYGVNLPLNKEESQSLTVDHERIIITGGSIRVNTEESDSGGNSSLMIGVGYSYLKKINIGLNYYLIKRINANDSFRSNTDGSISLVASYTIF